MAVTKIVYAESSVVRKLRKNGLLEMDYLKWTLEPDGKAAGCNPVEVGSIPTGVS